MSRHIISTMSKHSMNTPKKKNLHIIIHFYSLIGSNLGRSLAWVLWNTSPWHNQRNWLPHSSWEYFLNPPNPFMEFSTVWKETSCGVINASGSLWKSDLEPQSPDWLDRWMDSWLSALVPIVSGARTCTWKRDIMPTKTVEHQSATNQASHDYESRGFRLRTAS